MLWQLERHGSAIFYLSMGRFTLGRDEGCDLPLEEQGVSRLHATLEGVNQDLIVHDEESTNGVLVNGLPIDDWQVLEHGDEIAFGQEAFLDLVALEIPGDEPTLVLTQPSLGHWCLNQGEYTVGRDESADVSIAHPDLSRSHCLVSFDGIRIRIKDCNSTNGLFVDGKRLDEVELSSPGRVELGSVPLFFCLISAENTAFPAPASHPSELQDGGLSLNPPSRPSNSHSMPVAGWLIIGLVITALLVGGMVLFTDESSFFNQNRIAKQNAERTSIEERRARQAVSTVAADSALRNRLRNLSRKTGEVRDAWQPIASSLDRSAEGLQRLTGNSLTRRLIAGTGLETLASSLNSLSGNTRRLVDDLTGMPEDLSALERALQRYQSSPTRSNLQALSSPARRTISQGERIETLLGSISGSIGSVRSGLSTLASRAAGWPMGDGLADSARQSARILSNGQGVLDEYRSLLQRDLTKIRQLQREASQLN